MRSSPPGFEIERALGRDGGGPHLAWHRSLGRQVALRLASAELAADAGFRNRFLADAPLRKGLRHPGIARIYEAAAWESTLYWAVEYLPGGNLRQHLRRGFRLAKLMRLMQDIGAALDHAHGEGLLHLELKPENILFRLDGSAALSDFGLACALEGDRLPGRYAAWVGASSHRSPEQAAGQALDGRSDLYGLASVCYEVLTGKAPGEAGAAASGEAPRLPEASSRLPGHLSALQPVMDRALARNPQLRFASGAEFAAAFERACGAGALPEAQLRCGAVTAQEIHAVGGALLITAGRAERGERLSRRRRRRFRQALTAMLLASALGLGGYFVYAQPMLAVSWLARLGLGEDPLVQTAWADAQSLHRDPNQSLSAVAAGYRRVLALNAGHESAAQALAGLAAQWKESLVESLSQNDLAQAETKLKEVQGAFPEDPGLGDLQRRVTDYKAADRLLATTEALLRTHGVSDVPAATAAIQTYQEIMRLAPGHPVARQELAALAEHYAGLAGEAVAQGDVQGAIGFLERATAADEELPALASVRGRIQRAATAQAALGELLQQAGSYRAQGFLVSPQGDNAAELYNRVLATAPDNVIAQQGLEEVTSQLLSNAAQMLEEEALDETRLLLDQASAAGIDANALLEVRARLQERAERIASVRSNLENAERRLEEGFVTEPPEYNAVALLREVERLDPGNAEAAELLAQASARLAAAATEAHDAGLEDEAMHYLELALTVNPDVPVWRQLRASWE